MACDHGEGTMYQWRLDDHDTTCQEAGWTCECGIKLGYRPDLDRVYASEKAQAVLFWAHEHNFIYVSNGTMGIVIAENVAARMADEGLFDQYSVLRFILEDPNLSTHADYWRGKATERCGNCGAPMWETADPIQCPAGHKIDELTEAMSF